MIRQWFRVLSVAAVASTVAAGGMAPTQSYAQQNGNNNGAAIAAGILQGIANGLGGGGGNMPYPNYPPSYYPPSTMPYPPPYFPTPSIPTFPGSNTTVIYPSAMNPGANVPITPSQNNQTFVPGVGWVSTTNWIGADGQPHGNTTVFDPYGGSSTSVYRSNKHWGRRKTRLHPLPQHALEQDGIEPGEQIPKAIPLRWPPREPQAVPEVNR